MKELYSYGDYVTCMADSNPMPEYAWMNGRKTVRSQTLQLTGDMANGSWKCRAINVVDGMMKAVDSKEVVKMKDRKLINMY